MMEEMVVVDQQGNRYGGAAAFRYLTTRLPRLYVLAPLMHIPFTHAALAMGIQASRQAAVCHRWQVGRRLR